MEDLSSGWLLTFVILQLYTEHISCFHVKVSLCCVLLGIGGFGDEDTRELTESDPDTDSISIAGQIRPQFAPLNSMTACLNCVLLAPLAFQKFHQ